jgi:hypothetical protein
MRAIGQNTPAETIVNLGRKYQGERPFRHPKADLVRKVLLKAAISFQSRRPYRGEALQFTQRPASAIPPLRPRDWQPQVTVLRITIPSHTALHLAVMRSLRRRPGKTLQ